MNICPFCSTSDAQHKIGFNRTGTQRIRCTACRRIYTPYQKHRGYAPDLKKQAVCLYADGLSLRRIARTLSVNHHCAPTGSTPLPTLCPRHPGPPPVMLSNWMNCTPLSGTKKTVYLCTAVDRATRCIVGWGVSVERTWETLQAIVDQAPADNYFSDGFNVYPTLLYRQGLHQLRPAKAKHSA